MRGPLLFALIAAVGASGSAQQIIAPATAVRGAVVAAKDGLVLPAGEFTVAELIDAVATFLCRNYLYDHAPVQRAQGFSLQRPLALDALGAEEMLYALLSTREFAVLPIDEPRGVYQIAMLDPNQPRAGVLVSTPWRTAEEVLRRPQLREIVFTSLELRHADAQQLAALLRSAFGNGQWRPGCLLATATERHTLLLHGYRDQVANALAIGARFDRLCQPSAPTAEAALLLRLQRLEREVAELREQLAAALPGAAGAPLIGPPRASTR